MSIQPRGRMEKLLVRFVFVFIFINQLRSFNSQVCCGYLICYQLQQDQQIKDVPSVEPSVESKKILPLLKNIFYAPDNCPQGSNAINGRCRKIYSQPTNY